MKKLLLLLSGLFLFCAMLTAQTLRGTILKWNSQRQAVSGAQVMTADASPSISDADGNFTLIYRNKTAGSNVLLKVEKTGMEVVNAKDLAARLTNTPSEPLQIFMCAKGEIDKRRISFYQINEKNLTKQYESQLYKLKQEQKDNSLAIAALEQQYRSVLDQIKEYSDKLAVVNMDFVSDTYRSAFSFFEKGQFEEAIKMLDEQQLRQELLTAEKQISDAEYVVELAEAKRQNGLKIKKQVIQDFTLKGQLFVIQLRPDEAERVFKRAVEIDPSQFESLFELANFYQAQKQFETSITWFEKAQANAPGSYEKLNALNALGVVQRLNKNYQVSASEFIKALSIAEPLVQVNSDAYKMSLANILLNYAALQLETDKPLDAVKGLERAVELASAVNRNNGSAYLDIEAVGYTNLGLANSNLNRPGKAQEYYEKALGIFMNLAQKQGNKYQSDVAELHGKLGVVYFEQNKTEAGLESLNKALEMFEALAQKNPAAYNQLWLHSLSNSGAIYDEMMRPEEAEGCLLRAETLANEMAIANPEIYLVDKAEVYMNIGKFYLGKSPAKGAQYFLESYKIYNQLATLEPSVYTSKKATSMLNLGLTKLIMNNSNEGLSLLEETLQICEKLHKENPEKYNPFLSTAYSGLSVGYAMVNKQDKRQVMIQKAYQINASLSHSNPDAYLPQKAKNAYEISDAYYTAEKNQEGEPYLLEAIQIYEKLNQQVPGRYELELGMCLLNRCIYVDLPLYLQSGKESDYLNAQQSLNQAESLTEKAVLLKQNGLSEQISFARNLLNKIHNDKAKAGTQQPATNATPNLATQPNIAEPIPDLFDGVFVNLDDNGNTEIRLNKGVDGNYSGEVFTLGIKTASITAKPTPEGIEGKAKALFGVKFQMIKEGEKYWYKSLGLQAAYVKKEIFEQMKQQKAKQTSSGPENTTGLESSSDQRLIGNWNYQSSKTSGTGPGYTYSKTIIFYPNGTCTLGTGFAQNGITASSGGNNAMPYYTVGNNQLFVNSQRYFYSFEFSSKYGWILGLRTSLTEKEEIYVKR